MKRKGYLGIDLIIVSMMAFFMSGCGSQLVVIPDKIHVGVAYYNQTDTFLNELIACFKEDLEELGEKSLETTVTIRDAAGSQRTQNDQVKELIDAGCNVLCINLVDRADTSDIIDRAKEYEVPIIFFNREPVEEDLMQWDGLYYVGANAEESGMMQGELVAEGIKAGMQIDKNKDGKIQYVVLEGEAGHQDTIIRTENAVNTLKKYGIKLEKLSYQIANWNRAQAQNRMEQIIDLYHNDIELVLANNDDMALGAIDAYKKLNLTETALPVFFGIDGTNVGLKAIVDSKLAGTVYNDKEGQAKAMAKLSYALIMEEGMEDISFVNGKSIYLSYSKVTRENVGDFIEIKK